MQRLGLVLMALGITLAVFAFAAATVEAVIAWADAHLPGNPLLRGAMTLAGPVLSLLGLWLARRRPQQG